MSSVDVFFFFKQKTAYEMRISDWSSDVCSSDLPVPAGLLKDLGIDAKGLSAKYPNDPLYRSRNLGNATWFDKETFGADKLVKMPGGGHGESAGSREALTDRKSTRLNSSH